MSPVKKSGPSKNSMAVGNPAPTADNAVVGKNVTKIDAFKLARGEPVFTDDLVRPGQLYAKVLRSPHAHARIKNVDVSRALAAEGVVDVIWHRDVKAIAHTRAGQSYPEPSPYDTVILPDKARFIGDRVAVVAAETVAQAEAALDLIKVDYEVHFCSLLSNYHICKS